MRWKISRRQICRRRTPFPAVNLSAALAALSAVDPGGGSFNDALSADLSAADLFSAADLWAEDLSEVLSVDGSVEELMEDLSADLSAVLSRWGISLRISQWSISQRSALGGAVLVEHHSVDLSVEDHSVEHSIEDLLARPGIRGDTTACVVSGFDTAFAGDRLRFRFVVAELSRRRAEGQWGFDCPNARGLVSGLYRIAG